MYCLISQIVALRKDMQFDVIISVQAGEEKAVKRSVHHVSSAAFGHLISTILPSPVYVCMFLVCV